MKTATPKTETYERFRELIVWCELARAAFDAAVHADSPPALNALKEYLASVHTEMSEELRDWLAKRCTDESALSSAPPGTEGPWAQVSEAMSSNNEQVALAACWLMQRAVRAAYDRIAAPLPAERSARELIERHLRKLESIRTSTAQLQAELRHASETAVAKCPFFHALATAS